MKKELIRAAVDAADWGHAPDRWPHCGPGPVCPDKVVYVIFTRKLVICTGTCGPHCWPVGQECDEDREWKEHHKTGESREQECHKRRKGHRKHEHHDEHEHEEHEHDECRHEPRREPHDDCCEQHEDRCKQHREHCKPHHWEPEGDCCTREWRSWLEPGHRPRRTVFHLSS